MKLEVRVIRRVLTVLAIDRSIAWGLIGKSWSSIANLITIALIATKLGGAEQGIYYTVQNAASLSTFVEFGFLLTLMQCVSHEVATIKLDLRGIIEGPKARVSGLRQLFRTTLVWRGASGVFYLAICYIWCVAFLPNLKIIRANHALEPLIAYIIVNALGLAVASPLLSFFEGCNFVATVGKIRVLSLLCASAGTWLFLYLDLKIWSLVAFALVGVITQVIFMLFHFRKLLLLLLKKPEIKGNIWRSEMLPLQVKFIINSLCNYFIFSLYVPLTLRYCGPLAAGQVGMTQSLLSAMQNVAGLWIITKFPAYGGYVARGEIMTLNESFRKSTRMALFAIVGMGLVFILGLLSVAYSHSALVSRFVDIKCAMLFVGGSVLAVYSQCLGYYIIAFKVNPLAPVAVLAALVNVALAYVLIPRVGYYGCAEAFIIVNGVVTVPYMQVIYLRRRREMKNTVQVFEPAY